MIILKFLKLAAGFDEAFSARAQAIPVESEAAHFEHREADPAEQRSQVDDCCGMLAGNPRSISVFRSFQHQLPKGRGSV